LFTEHIVRDVSLLGPRECKDPANVVRVANFAFGTKRKNHPFLKLVIDECLRRLQMIQGPVSQSDILWVCGPDVITTMYHKHKTPDVILLDNTYLRHFCYGSWR
jgi:hypothetical protein